MSEYSRLPPKATDSEAIPYRIRIGVTGHRIVPDPVGMKEPVGSAIDSEIHKLFSDKWISVLQRVHQRGFTAITFGVLTPLAEGADRIVACAVRRRGSRLDVVLTTEAEWHETKQLLKLRLGIVRRGAYNSESWKPRWNYGVFRLALTLSQRQGRPSFRTSPTEQLTHALSNVSEIA